ncbi:hypothetical protein SPRG_18655 [Saprolegnia parasitica CBS 223.65]|uniref:Uncharacterized protein n=1 Tax=Saprolegnia parasitica (strain CBS 223.65) TaxID=695850 RepID=A0A067BGE8_SAPPC|nr:hypothetical protein SPRG_18655 [Saprolegnia parasitica CBS 223.65]KDO15810.1 hypothetical protein SPRG_18655 [Saprolegnia parasitica CBS 223.65]|eukprot:XP_012213483.1 hypothetical protein SPRG_18655 [Saprolegnia parasitica CBS 223.65]
MYHRGVVPTDTRDSLHRERFHQYSPEQVYYWPDDVNDFDHWNYASIYDAQNWFSDHIGIGWRNGVRLVDAATTNADDGVRGTRLAALTDGVMTFNKSLLDITDALQTYAATHIFGVIAPGPPVYYKYTTLRAATMRRKRRVTASHT